MAEAKEIAWWEVQHLVTADHAIGGRPYFHPIEDEAGNRAFDEQSARALYAQALANRPQESWRLVRVERFVVEHNLSQAGPQ